MADDDTDQSDMLKELKEAENTDETEENGEAPKPNYIITFASKTKTSYVFVDNATGPHTEINDPETGEPASFYYALVTELGEAGDAKLAQMCDAMDAAQVHHHTYDAKSGGGYRITRVGATAARLDAFAAVVNFQRSFDPAALEAACAAKNLVLENPEYSSARGWYKPYEHLGGPYESDRSELYVPLSPGERTTLMRRLVSRPAEFKGLAKGCAFDLEELNSNSEKDQNDKVLAVFAIHDLGARQALHAEWMALAPPWKLPIDAIRGYLGEEVGFYFAFLAHIATGLLCLVPLAVPAFAASTYFLVVSGPSWDYRGVPEAAFALCSCCAYAIIMDAWGFHQNRIAHLWNSYKCGKLEPPRPGFNGLVCKNPVNGELEIDFPEYMRRPRLVVSVVTSSTLLFVLVCVVVSIFVFKYLLKKWTENPFILLAPSVLNSIQITVFGIVYKFMAQKLTEWENHKSVLAHNSALFAKLTSAYFVNNYAALFYIAFVKRSLEGCYNAYNDSDSCGLELSTQVATIFVITDFITRVMKSVVAPFFTKRLKGVLAARDESKDADKMGEIEKQFVLLGNYEPTSELIMDYIELYVQWGYLCLFGCAFPLAPLLAFITNFIETRSDGSKLLWDFRRVGPNRVDGIGEPLKIFFYTLYLAVPVNAALVVFTYDTFHFVDPEYKVWVFVGLCAVLVLAMRLSEALYPEMPMKTAVQLARQEVVQDRVVQDEPLDDDAELDIAPEMLGMTLAKVQSLKREKREADPPVVSRRTLKPGEQPGQTPRRASSQGAGTGGGGGYGALGADDATSASLARAQRKKPPPPPATKGEKLDYQEPETWDRQLQHNLKTPDEDKPPPPPLTAETSL